MHPFTIEKIIKNNQKECGATMPADGKTEVNHDLLLTLVANFIKAHPDKVISLLKTYKFHVNDKPTTAELVTTLTAGLSRSKKLAIALTQAMQTSQAVHSATRPQGTLHNAAGCTTTPTPAPSGFAAILGDTASIINGLGAITGGKARANADTATANAQQAEATAALAKKTEPAKSNAGLYVGLAVGFIMLIGGIIAVVKMTKGTPTPAA